MLEIPASELAAIATHGERAYPEECCGFLIGHPSDEGDDGADADGGDPGACAAVVRAKAAENTRDDERARRYTIAPEVVLHTLRAARADGLEIIGYYHSHPDHPAEPSAFDREHAWPGVSYLIVPVTDGRAGAARSWRLTEDSDGFVEEAVAVAAAPVPAGTARASEVRRP